MVLTYFYGVYDWFKVGNASCIVFAAALVANTFPIHYLWFTGAVANEHWLYLRLYLKPLQWIFLPFFIAIAWDLDRDSANFSPVFRWCRVITEISVCHWKNEI